MWHWTTAVRLGSRRLRIMRSIMLFFDDGSAWVTVSHGSFRGMQCGSACFPCGPAFPRSLFIRLFRVVDHPLRPSLPAGALCYAAGRSGTSVWILQRDGLERSGTEGNAAWAGIWRRMPRPETQHSDWTLTAEGLELCLSLSLGQLRPPIESTRHSPRTYFAVSQHNVRVNNTIPVQKWNTP